MSLTVEASQDSEVRPALARAVLEQGWDLLELRLLHVSLEDVFIDLVTEESEDETTTEDNSLQEEAS